MRYPVWIPFLAGGLLGLALGLIGTRRSQFGIDRRVLAEHALWLLPEESVLLLQAPLHTFRYPQIVIRDSGETQPTVFLLHPRRKREPVEDPEIGCVASAIAASGIRAAAGEQPPVAHQTDPQRRTAPADHPARQGHSPDLPGSLGRQPAGSSRPHRPRNGFSTTNTSSKATSATSKPIFRAVISRNSRF